MKLKYFYDGQFRRTLKHLIRVFGGFQVQHGVDAEGNPRYKPVPCRYADFSRMAMYIINGGSENVQQYAPMMTISVASLKIARQDVRAPMSQTVVMGENVSTGVNQYEKKLDKQWAVERYNPVPWDLTFNVNIWTTTTQAKLELFEQIASVFNPSIQLQLSENPLDWTSLTNIELMDCEFSSRGMTQGTDTDLDIMTLTFKCQIWLSLPAIVSQPKLIQQIVTNIKTGSDDLDIDLGIGDEIVTDVFTPKNMCIVVDRVNSTQQFDTYEVTLVGQNMLQQSNTGKVYSWDLYLQYLNPEYLTRSIYLKFQTGIEDPNAIRADIISYPTEEEPNKLIVQVDTSLYRINYSLTGFIDEVKDLAKAIPEQYYINISPINIVYKESVIPPNSLFKTTNNGVEIIDPSTMTGYVYSSQDQHYYTYTSTLGWHQTVMNKYRQGYWRVAIRNV